MKENFIVYLKKIGLDEEAIKRIEEIYVLFNQTFNYEIEDIFVEDSIDSIGNRKYNHLQFFSKNNIFFDAVDFLSEYDYNIYRFNKISSVHISTSNYNFKESTKSSRLTVELLFNEISSETDYSFEATRENCDALRDILIKYFIEPL